MISFLTPNVISTILALYLLLGCKTQSQWTEKRREIRATKGQFMVYILHSAYFFSPQTVDVKWSASLRDKPELPHWLHLIISRHKPIAYLIGTPVTPLPQQTIHVVARRLDNFQSAERFFTILLDDNRLNLLNFVAF